MAYATERKRIGRKPFQIVKLSLDYCTKSYGVNTTGSVCTAGISGSGTVQAATANTVDLESSESSVDDAYNNYAIHITGGTGQGQVLRILDWDGTNRRATMESNWSTTPDVTSTYDLIQRPQACYNTRSTCQDTTNYNADATTKEVYLTEPTSKFPVNLLDESGLAVAVPCLGKVNITEPVISLTKGLGIRGAISVNCKDFPHHDRGLDKYVDSRNYTPESQGTFWGKLLARNPYYQGRTLTLYRGYLSQTDQFDSSNFEQYHFIVEKMDGPDNTDMVRITGKDPLKLADNDRAKAPTANTGKLLTSINDSDTTATLTPIGVGDSEYSASGTVRMGEELMTFTRSGDTLTITRAQNNSVAAAHNANTSVQECLVYSSTNVVDIVEDLLENYTNLTASQLDTGNWATEKSAWLNSNNLSTVITKPTGVTQLIKELAEQNMFYMWWDQINQLVKLKAIAPSSADAELTDNENFVHGTVKIEDAPELRKSQVWVYYGVNDYTEIKRENYENLYIQVSTDEETDDKYGDSRIEIIESRWITSEALAIQLAGRLLALYLDNPKIATFNLDNKDDVELGDKLDITTRTLQDVDGSTRSLHMVVTEARELEPGSINQYKAIEFSFTGRYGYISHSQIGEVDSATASTVVLDSRTSKHETPSTVVPDAGPDIDVDGTATSTIEYDDDILVDFIYEQTGGANAGYIGTITDYDKATKTITVTPPFSTTPVSGDSYKIYPPEYSGAYLLLEDTGDFLLLEDGGLIVLENASQNGAPEYMKSKYAWISPGDTFDDGSEAYKIL
jgi:hypothetical protein